MGSTTPRMSSTSACRRSRSSLWEAVPSSLCSLCRTKALAPKSSGMRSGCFRATAVRTLSLDVIVEVMVFPAFQGVSVARRRPGLWIARLVRRRTWVGMGSPIRVARRQKLTIDKIADSLIVIPMLNLLTHGYGQFTPRHPVGPVAWPHFDLFYVHSGRIRLRFTGAPDVVLAQDEGVLIYPDTPFKGSVLTAEVSASVQHFAIEPPDNPVLSELCGLRLGFEVFRRPHSAEVGRDIVRAMALAVRPGEARTQALREAQLTVILGILRNSAR